MKKFYVFAVAALVALSVSAVAFAEEAPAPDKPAPTEGPDKPAPFHVGQNDTDKPVPTGEPAPKPE